MADENRFDRTYDYLKLSSIEIEGLIGPFLNGKVIGSELLAGGFANTNYRFRMSEGNKEYVLRLPQKNKSEFKKEIAVLKLVATKVPVPKVIAGSEELEPFTVLEFTQGERLSAFLPSLKKSAIKSVAADIGRVLADIHSFQLESAGFFNENFKFTFKFPNFGAAYLEHFRSEIAPDFVRRRIGSTLVDKIDGIIREHEADIVALTPCNTLLHCDFNPKNLLIMNDQVSAVLDWEYSSTGHFLADIGNFLRFEEDYPPGFKEAFLDGYQVHAGPLPASWEIIAKILDFAAIANFLSDQPEIEMPQAARTAVGVLQKTADFF